jgi:dTDP-4-amino-4,6-dideoxygalactose transaminase
VTIPLFDTERMLEPLREAVNERLREIVAAGRFVLGPEVAAFESKLAAYLGVGHVIGVGNGTDAITIALRALGVQAGDEVVVPSFTFYASVEAVVSAGARPVFCDVDPGTRNLTVDTVRAVLTPRTRALVAVDLFGCPAPIPELRELGLPVLEDAAQALGASLDGRRAGSLGDAATISFYPSKNLGAFGDAGAIATDDAAVADLARALRFHGSRDKRHFQYVGYNSRLDEIQAAILRVLLPNLDGWVEGRRAAARGYLAAGLAEHVAVPQVPAGAEPAWHLYVVASQQAERLASALAERGVESRGYYRTPVHRQPGMAEFGHGVELPVTEELARTNLALPMSPGLGSQAAAEVVAAVAGALEKTQDSAGRRET